MGLAETFKALSDPVRREILMMLRDGKKPAGDRFSFLVGHLALELLQFPFLRKNIVCICNANTNDE